VKKAKEIGHPLLIGVAEEKAAQAVLVDLSYAGYETTDRSRFELLLGVSARAWHNAGLFFQRSNDVESMTRAWLRESTVHLLLHQEGAARLVLQQGLRECRARGALIQMESLERHLHGMSMIEPTFPGLVLSCFSEVGNYPRNTSV